ncbi:MAG: alpha/beta fold hydrolase [Actinobacteria bacterium]|nr:alpha/beta fold hydrolase [Actinomycetota bacterium]
MTRSTVATTSGDVSVVVDGPTEQPPQLLVLAHGAGASMDSDFMKFFAHELADDQRAVARFNFAYMEQGRRSPGPAKASEATFTDVLAHLRDELSPRSVFIGGKSYGGRIASHIASAGADVDGLVFLGYPLHAPGRPENMRDDHLYGIRCRMLFVEGTRDPFCPLATLEKVRQKLSDSALLVVEDGDHSLKVRNSSGRDSRDAWQQAVSGIREWMDG